VIAASGQATLAQLVSLSRLQPAAKADGHTTAPAALACDNVPADSAELAHLIGLVSIPSARLTTQCTFPQVNRWWSGAGSNRQPSAFQGQGPPCASGHRRLSACSAYLSAPRTTRVYLGG
jgi:hypothetical protein